MVKSSLSNGFNQGHFHGPALPSLVRWFALGRRALSMRKGVVALRITWLAGNLVLEGVLRTSMLVGWHFVFSRKHCEVFHAKSPAFARSQIAHSSHRAEQDARRMQSKLRIRAHRASNTRRVSSMKVHAEQGGQPQ